MLIAESTVDRRGILRYNIANYIAMQDRTERGRCRDSLPDAEGDPGGVHPGGDRPEGNLGL